MKKIDVGQTFGLLANAGVIISILLLVFELNQAREFARVEFVANNLNTFQEIEREILNPALAEIWVKAAIDPAFMTLGEIRVMDAYLLGHLNVWREYWTLEQDELVEAGSARLLLETNVPFFFGNAFAEKWWNEVKSYHAAPEDLAFDQLVDDVLAGTTYSDNRRFLEDMQRMLRE